MHNGLSCKVEEPWDDETSWETTDNLKKLLQKIEDHHTDKLSGGGCGMLPLFCKFLGIMLAQGH